MIGNIRHIRTLVIYINYINTKSPTLQIFIIIKYFKLFRAKQNEKIRKIQYMARYTLNFCQVCCINT